MIGIALSALQDGAHSRWPPSRTTMTRRCLAVVEVARDLSQASAGGTLRPDVADEVGREGPWSSGFCRLRSSSSWPPPFGDQSLELVHRNQAGSPGHLDRLDQREDAAVERRAADAEGLGRLCAGVREPLDAGCLANDLYGRGRGFERRRVSLSLRTLASDTAARHMDNIHKL